MRKRKRKRRREMKIPIKAIRLDFQDPEHLFGEKVWEIAQAMPPR
jgi:hypothetical protein